jgi:putative peptidoglycan lipid II flippase
MVTRVINLFYREVRGLHQAAYVLALFALASQVLALVRDRILANQFGAGSELDMYYAAFRIPDLLFVLFASVLSVYVLLPFVAKARTESDAAAQHILSQMFSLFCVVYTAIAAVCFFLAPVIVTILYPDFTPGDQTVVVSMMRVLLLQPLLLGLSSLLGVVTQIQHRFVVYAISPLLYNMGIILGATVLYSLFGLVGIMYGVVLGALGHVLIQLPLVYRSSLQFGFTAQFDLQLLRKIGTVALPRAITLSLSQLQFLVLVSLASTMVVGSVSVLQFAFNLQSVPLAIIGMSYSVAAFPTLAELLAQKKHQEFNAFVLTALRHIIFWSVPVVVLVVVLRAQIVRVLLGSGSFDWADTRLTAAVLALFVVSLTAQAMILLIVRAFYAGGYTRLPLLLTLIGTALGSFVAYASYVWFQSSPLIAMQFASLLRLEGVAGAEVLMLPLGYTLGVVLQVLLMLFFLARTYTLSLTGLRLHFLQSCLASLAGGFVAYATLLFVVEGVNQDRFLGIFMQGLTAGVLGIITVIAVYRLQGSPEMHEIYTAFRSRIFKTDVISPQPDVL